MESPWDSNESTLLTTPAVPTPGGVTFVAPTIPQQFVSRPAANKKRGRIFCRQNGFKKMCVGKYWADFDFTNSGFIFLILFIVSMGNWICIVIMCLSMKESSHLTPNQTDCSFDWKLVCCLLPPPVGSSRLTTPALDVPGWPKPSFNSMKWSCWASFHQFMYS